MFNLPYEPSDLDDTQIRDCYLKVFNSPDGKIVLNHLLGEQCTMHKAAYDEQDIGMQTVGHRILNLMKG